MMKAILAALAIAVPCSVQAAASASASLTSSYGGIGSSRHTTGADFSYDTISLTLAPLQSVVLSFSYVYDLRTDGLPTQNNSWAFCPPISNAGCFGPTTASEEAHAFANIWFDTRIPENNETYAWQIDYMLSSGALGGDLLGAGHLHEEGTLLVTVLNTSQQITQHGALSLSSLSYVNVSPIPEPPMLPMVLAGLGLLFVTTRRRQRCL